MKSHEVRYQWKFHLGQLPTITAMSQWQGVGDFACLVIPIFSFDGSTEFIESYIAKAAAWSLKTWKENSDAFEFNVPCYIYVETQVADAALPILAENQVPTENIKIADFPNGEWLGKCMQPVFDKDFDDYQYTVISDIDMFCARGGESGQLLPFFEKVQKHAPKGFGCKVFNEIVPYYWMPHMKQAYEYQYPDGNYGDIVETWCAVITRITGVDIAPFVKDTYNPRPWTGVMVIEQGLFSDKEWLELVCKMTGDDEATIYAWSKISPLNRVWDFDDIGIDIFVDFLRYIDACYTRLYEKHGKLDGNTDFREMSLDKPCLIHHCHSIDYKFYKMVGVS